MRVYGPEFSPSLGLPGIGISHSRGVPGALTRGALRELDRLNARLGAIAEPVANPAAQAHGTVPGPQPARTNQGDGGQGRNRTSDTRIFSSMRVWGAPSERHAGRAWLRNLLGLAPPPQGGAVGHCLYGGIVGSAPGAAVSDGNL